MTINQLKRVQDELKIKYPEYCVVRGGIFSSYPSAGIEKITISGPDCKTIEIEFDFNTNKII